MLVYWASTFIVPKKVPKEVNNILRSFMWWGVELKHTGAKVSWEDVCLPKAEGGLGIKNVEIWNEATISKHIWFLISWGEESMWCQWVKSYLLKGRSFWHVKIPQDSSWVWRKLLRLRTKFSLQPYKFKIGNGFDIFKWHDNWHPNSPLL